MPYDDSPLSWVQEARDTAIDIGARRNDDKDLPPLCSAIVCLADALKTLLTKEEAK